MDPINWTLLKIAYLHHCFFESIMLQKYQTIWTSWLMLEWEYFFYLLFKFTTKNLLEQFSYFRDVFYWNERAVHNFEMLFDPKWYRFGMNYFPHFMKTFYIMTFFKPSEVGDFLNFKCKTFYTALLVVWKTIYDFLTPLFHLLKNRFKHPKSTFKAIFL